MYSTPPTKDNIQKSGHPALLSVSFLGRMDSRWLQTSLGPSFNWLKVNGKKKNNPIRSPSTLFKTGVYKMQTYTHRQKLCLGVDSYSLSPGCTPVLASCQIVPFYGTLPRVVSGSGTWIPPTQGDKWDCWSPATAIGIKDYSVSMDTETGTRWLPKLPGF